MKIEFDIHPDASDPSGRNHLVRLAGPVDVLKAKLVVIPVKRDGTTDSTDDSANKITITPTGLGTVSTVEPDITRTLVVIEWVDTKSGRWVLDSADPKVPVKEVAKDGLKALPKGIPEEKKKGKK